MTGGWERRRVGGADSRDEMRRADWPAGRVVEDEMRRAAWAKRLAPHLADDDIERVAFLHSRFFSVLIATITGVPLDPYSLAEIHRSVDGVAGMIPLSGWTLPALRVRAVLHSTICSDRPPALSLDARHIDTRAGRRDREDAARPAGPAVVAELRRRIGAALPKGLQSEARLLDIVVWRRRRVG